MLTQYKILKHHNILQNISYYTNDYWLIVPNFHVVIVVKARDDNKKKLK